MLSKVDCFGPILSERRIAFGANDTRVIDRSTVDDLIRFDGHDLLRAVANLAGEGRESLGVEFVEVEPFRFPVFVQAEGKIEAWLLLQPIHVKFYLRRVGREVVSI